jgi:Putative  PD-(D/E)XK family member, (DUF4420)
MLDLVTLFNSLQSPDDTAGQAVRFSAQSILGYEKHRLAKDTDNTPSLLISVTDGLEAKRPIPIKLEHLIVQYDVDCRISQSDGSIEEGQFTIVRCIGADKALHIYFLHCIGAILVSLGTMPSRLDIAYAIKNLTTLFRSMTEKPRKSIQGLWAELFLIARAHDVATMVAAWHITPEDRYDFNSGNQRIEVKSTASRRRHHFFSLEQLNPPSDTTLFIASLFMEYAGAGASVMELAEQVRERISGDPELLLHMDQIISSTLGENWRDALEARFDLELAEDSLAFFEVSTIPTVDRNLPSGVSDVKFRSDLTNCLPTPVQNFQALGGLFQAASGRRSILSPKSKRRNSIV